MSTSAGKETMQEQKSPVAQGRGSKHAPESKAQLPILRTVDVGSFVVKCSEMLIADPSLVSQLIAYYRGSEGLKQVGEQTKFRLVAPVKSGLWTVVVMVEDESQETDGRCGGLFQSDFPSAGSAKEWQQCMGSRGRASESGERKSEMTADGCSAGSEISDGSPASSSSLYQHHQRAAAAVEEEEPSKRFNCADDPHASTFKVAVQMILLNDPSLEAQLISQDFVDSLHWTDYWARGQSALHPSPPLHEEQQESGSSFPLVAATAAAVPSTVEVLTGQLGVFDAETLPPYSSLTSEDLRVAGVENTEAERSTHQGEETQDLTANGARHVIARPDGESLMRVWYDRVCELTCLGDQVGVVDVLGGLVGVVCGCYHFGDIGTHKLQVLRHAASGGSPPKQEAAAATASSEIWGVRILFGQ